MSDRVLRLFGQFEALAKMALVHERLAGMRASYRACDLIPALNALMADLDTIEAKILDKRRVQDGN